MTAASAGQATWRKSSYSGGNGSNCVEVGTGGDLAVVVRDTRDRAGAVLTLGPGAWARFTASLR